MVWRRCSRLGCESGPSRVISPPPTTIECSSAIAVTALKEHRRRHLEERLWAGEAWQDHGYVFASTVGTAVDPRNLSREFYKLRARAGLDWRCFYDPRHGYASLLMAQCVNPRVVQEILGHSQVSLTLGTYSHEMPELARDAANWTHANLTG